MSQFSIYLIFTIPYYLFFVGIGLDPFSKLIAADYSTHSRSAIINKDLK